MKFFTYDKVSGEVSINNESILLIREFDTLMDNERNKTKEDKLGKLKTKAFKEFKYIYLFFDWESPYFQYSEQERHKESLLDSKLTDSEFKDSLFLEACKKYETMQNMLLDVRLLKAAMEAIESQIYYLAHVDLNERDQITGKPIFKSKDLIAEIKGCKDLISSLRELESQVKKGMETESNLRGGTQIGMFD